MNTPNKVNVAEDKKLENEKTKDMQHNVDEATSKEKVKAQKSVDAYDAPDVRAYNASVAANPTPPPDPVQTEPSHESYITKPKDASADVEKPVAQALNPHAINPPAHRHDKSVHTINRPLSKEEQHKQDLQRKQDAQHKK